MGVDVIVVGLGSMGASAAYHLAARGMSVVGLDRFVPPHDRGAHAGGSRIIRMAYMEGVEYVPLVRRSYELWRQLAADSGDELLITTGGLMMGRRDSRAVAGALDSARMHGLAHEVLDADQVRCRFPAFTPANDEVGLVEEAAGLIRPEAAVAAYLRMAREYGVSTHAGVEVLDWESDGDQVRVSTSDAVYEAGRLVLAPGAWAGELTRLPGAGATSFRVQRRVQHYWRPADPTLFEVGRLPVWIWEYGPGEMAYGLPSVDGLVKAALHHGDEEVDPDIGAEPARSQEVDAMTAWLRTHLPGLASGHWGGAKPCLYTLTPDEHFVVGLHPDYTNVAVACGFSGHGFKFVPVVGEILADLMTAGSTTHPIGLFSPSRLQRGLVG